ncbi:hypothetical protein ACLOJK_012565 [Asimina triloba]
MAEDLDDGEFWLPSQFLAEDIAMDNKNRTPEPALSCFPDEFPYGFDSYGSALGSPVESVVGSTETESDEEDFLAGLTRQMADSSMIQEEGKLTGFPAIGMDNPKPKVLAGSPQSTLCAVGSWSRCSLGSSRGSSNGPSQVSSPPSTPLERKDDALDLLYAAAGQVVRMKLNDEGSKFPGRGLLGPPRKAAPATAAPLKTPCAGYHHNQELAHQQLQNSQVGIEEIGYYCWAHAIELTLFFCMVWSAVPAVEAAATDETATTAMLSWVGKAGERMPPAAAAAE